MCSDAKRSMLPSIYNLFHVPFDLGSYPVKRNFDSQHSAHLDSQRSSASSIDPPSLSFHYPYPYAESLVTYRYKLALLGTLAYADKFPWRQCSLMPGLLAVLYPDSRDWTLLATLRYDDLDDFIGMFFTRDYTLWLEQQGSRNSMFSMYWHLSWT